MNLKSKTALILVGSAMLLTACGNSKQTKEQTNNNEVAIYKQAKEPKEHVWFDVMGTNEDSELDNIIFVKNGKIKVYTAGMIYKTKKIVRLKDVQDLSMKEIEKKAKKWNKLNVEYAEENNSSNGTEKQTGNKDPKFKKIKVVKKKDTTKTEFFNGTGLIRHIKGHVKKNGQDYLIYNLGFSGDLNDIEKGDSELQSDLDDNTKGSYAGYLIQPTDSSNKKAVIDSQEEPGIKLITNNYD